MVQEASFERVIKRAAVADVFRVLHQHPDMLEAYHKQLGSQNVVVGQWEHNQRTVQYDLKVKLPAVAKAFVAVDTVTMREVQTVMWQDDSDGNAGYVVDCVPTILIPGGDRFTSPARFQFTQRQADVHVACRVRCTAAVWGLVGTIEPMMLAEASDTLTKFIDFAASYFAGHSAVLLVGADLVASTPSPLSVVTLDAASAASVSVSDLEPSSVDSGAALEDEGVAAPPHERAAPAAALADAAETFYDSFEPLDHAQVMQQLRALQQEAHQSSHTGMTCLVETRVLARRLEALQESLHRIELLSGRSSSWFYLSPTTVAFMTGLLLGVGVVAGAAIARERVVAPPR